MKVVAVPSDQGLASLPQNRRVADPPAVAVLLLAPTLAVLLDLDAPRLGIWQRSKERRQPLQDMLAGRVLVEHERTHAATFSGRCSRTNATYSRSSRMQSASMPG